MRPNRAPNRRILPLCATFLLLAATARAQAPAASSDRDPTVAGLTLAEVYELARERNPRVSAAASLAEAREAKVPSAGLPPDPFFQIGAMNFQVPDLNDDMAMSMVPSVQLGQTLPFPGKLGLAERIAEKTSAMARSDAEETWWSIRARAGRAFYELYAVDHKLEVMRKTLALLGDFEKIARAMYTAGTGPQADVLRAGVEVARMDAEIATMEALREVAASRLNALLDRPADTPVPSPAYPDLPDSVPGRDTLRGWAEQTRAMLEKGRTDVERAGTSRELARKEVWPDLALGVQYGQRDRGFGVERMASVLVGFSLPVFAGSRQLRLRDEAAAMERMAIAELADMRASVDAEIGEHLAELERARSLIALYRGEVLPQAEANVESSLSSYRVGHVDFLTLVDAQTTLNRYEQEYYGLLADYGRHVAELEATVGRELPNTQNLAEVR